MPKTSNSSDSFVFHPLQSSHLDLDGDQNWMVAGGSTANLLGVLDGNLAPFFLNVGALIPPVLSFGPWSPFPRQ